VRAYHEICHAKPRVEKRNQRDIGVMELVTILSRFEHSEEHNKFLYELGSKEFYISSGLRWPRQYHKAKMVSSSLQKNFAAYNSNRKFKNGKRAVVQKGRNPNTS
jgi:hypothetical protein